MNDSERRLIRTFMEDISIRKYSYRTAYFAKVFGAADDVQAACQNDEAAFQKIGKNILDCLYGKRPDMQIKIWDMVIEAISCIVNDSPASTIAAQKEICEVRISMLDKKIIEHHKMDFGTIILLRLIAAMAESTEEISSQVIPNPGNQDLISIFMSYSERSAYIFINDYSMKDDVVWTQPYLVIPQVPQMIETQLRGRKLTDVINHPAFNEIDITITDTFSNDDDLDYLVTDLQTDYRLSKETTFNVYEYASQEVMRLCTSCPTKGSCKIERCRLFRHYNE